MIIAIGNYSLFIDDEDYPLINGKTLLLHKSSTKLIYIKIRNIDYNNPRKKFFLHRLILGVTDKNVFIDHKDGNPLNNHRSNLRVSTPSQNSMNRAHTNVNKVGFKGVWQNGPNRWSTTIRVDGVKHYGGIFKTPREAATKYNEMARQYHGEFAYQNKI